MHWCKDSLTHKNTCNLNSSLWKHCRHVLSADMQIMNRAGNITNDQFESYTLQNRSTRSTVTGSNQYQGKTKTNNAHAVGKEVPAINAGKAKKGLRKLQKIYIQLLTQRGKAGECLQSCSKCLGQLGSLDLQAPRFILVSCSKTSATMVQSLPGGEEVSYRDKASPVQNRG